MKLLGFHVGVGKIDSAGGWEGGKKTDGFILSVYSSGIRDILVFVGW